MNNQMNEARLAVQKAREALRNNNRTEARKWAEQAASLAPQSEDPWLVLAAIADPRDSMEYIQRALRLNPNSPRAQKGLEWAQSRLPKNEAAEKPREITPAQSSSLIGLLPRAQSARQQILPAHPDLSTHPEAGNPTPRTKRSPLYPVLFLIVGLLICAVAAWSATTSPVLALLANNAAPTPSHPASWAQVTIAKPTDTPSAPMAEALPSPTPQPLNLVNNLPDVPTQAPTDIPTDAPTAIPTAIPTDVPIPAPTDAAAVSPDNPLPTAEPSNNGGLTLTYVEDTPTSEIPTVALAPTPASGSQTNYASTGDERWIDVNLSQQMVYAYEGNTVVNSFLVSTGTWQYPTVTGKYHIYVKYRYTDMAGPGYYLPNVPYTMYFYRGYGLHGTYWHHNFGTPMSHGCVNLSIPDSEWLYNWASVGTLVNVHY